MFWRVLATVVLMSPLATASAFGQQRLRVSAMGMNGIGLGAQGDPDADEVGTTNPNSVWSHAPHMLLSSPCPCSECHGRGELLVRRGYT
jgi:hypothetical protein